MRKLKLLALGFWLVGAAHAADLQFQKQFVQPVGKGQWSVFAHAPAGGLERLILIDQETLRVHIFDPAEQKVKLSYKLDAQIQPGGVRSISGLTTRAGEFVIGFINGSRAVELHPLRGDAFSLKTEGTARSLTLTEPRAGLVLLTVKTEDGRTEAFAYENDDLKPARLSAHAQVSNNPDDRAMSAEVEAAESQALAVAEGVQAGDEVRLPLAFAKPQVYGLGGATWTYWGASGERGPVLSVLGPDKRVTNLGIGDSASVKDVGYFLFAGKPYYYFVRDNGQLFVQNRSELIQFTNADGERVTGATLVRSNPALAFVVWNKAGSRLILIRARSV